MEFSIDVAVLLQYLGLNPIAIRLISPSAATHNTQAGGVAEWSIASVLKTEVGQPTVGSNPTPSAIVQHDPRKSFSFKGLRVINGNCDRFSTHNSTQVDAEAGFDDPETQTTQFNRGNRNRSDQGPDLHDQPKGWIRAVHPRIEGRWQPTNPLLLLHGRGQDGRPAGDRSAHQRQHRYLRGDPPGPRHPSPLRAHCHRVRSDSGGRSSPSVDSPASDQPRSHGSNGRTSSGTAATLNWQGARPRRQQDGWFRCRTT